MFPLLLKIQQHILVLPLLVLVSSFLLTLSTSLQLTQPHSLLLQLKTTSSNTGGIGVGDPSREVGAVPRSNFLKRAVLLSTTAAAIGGTSSSTRTTALAFSPPAPKDTLSTTSSRGRRMAMTRTSSASTAGSISQSSKTVAYRSLSIDMPGYGVQVPVAMWSPSNTNNNNNNSDENSSSSTSSSSSAIYSHRISIKKIGSMLLGSDFIPQFLSKDFSLSPTYGGVLGGDGTVSSGGVSSRSAPVIILAHGYLGSRFDLSHIAEELAREGFTCLSPEYPESLASSYPTTTNNLDRTAITNQLLSYITTDLNLTPTSYGIVGHSLGCGTALNTGDKTWTRVCIAGPAVRRDGVDLGGNTLSIVSLGDGLLGGDRSRVDSMIPPSFDRIDESSLTTTTKYASKTALILDRPDAPNHISFLAGNVNDSMVTFLSPLLPVAQALSIPVLDFDRYKESRDSVVTAGVTVPLICGFFKQFLV